MSLHIHLKNGGKTLNILFLTKIGDVQYCQYDPHPMTKNVTSTDYFNHQQLTIKKKMWYVCLCDSHPKMYELQTSTNCPKAFHYENISTP